IPFEEVGAILGRSAVATRQLASRARRRVRETPTDPRAATANERKVVGAFLAASRAADLEAVVAVLDPKVVLRADRGGLSNAPLELRGTRAVAKQALAYSSRAKSSQLALVNGTVGVVVAPRGHLMVALRYTVERGVIVEIEVMLDPVRLGTLDVAVLDEPTSTERLATDRRVEKPTSLAH